MLDSMFIRTPHYSLYDVNFARLKKQLTATPESFAGSFFSSYDFRLKGRLSFENIIAQVDYLVLYHLILIETRLYLKLIVF